MPKNKIVFLCHVSNPDIRQNLELNNYPFRRFVYSFMGGKTLYEDFAIWVTDYITEFEKHPEYDIHIVAPHWGMKRDFQNFERNGIKYHFFKCNSGLLYTTIDKYFHIEEHNRNINNRRKISRIIGDIDPDMVILCGAENAYYASGVLDIKEKPVYVILQTLLNDPKRIEMGLGTPYKREIELEVFTSAQYFSTTTKKENDTILKVNPDAVFLPVRFPSHRPTVSIPREKEFDFVFFAMHIGKNKGIEDALKAVAFVKKKKDDVSFVVIGKCTAEYKKHLDEMIDQLDIADNVRFAGYYQEIQDTFNNVVKARAVVVSGITALNSTVRESMYMGMPTICYEIGGVADINKENCCLLTAPVGDVESLSEQMLFVINNPEQAQQIAENGKLYAERVYSNEAIVNKLLDNCHQIIEKRI